MPFWGPTSILFGECDSVLFWGPTSILTGECAALDDAARQLWPPGEQTRTSELGGLDTTGIILKDRTTGDSYRVFVDNGTLSVEVV